MIPEELPDWIKEVCEKLVSFGFFPRDKPPNQVLLNEYSFGAGIEKHKDGKLFEDCAAVLSMESSALINFYLEREEGMPIESGSADILDHFSILLKPRSLVVFASDAYNHYTHEVKDSASELVHELVLNGAPEFGSQILRGDRRISLTLRHAKERAVRDLDDPLKNYLSEEDRKEIERRKSIWFNSISEKN